MELKYLFLFITICVVITEADKYLSEKPSYITVCKINDADFNKCVASNFQAFFLQWKDGVPGLSGIGSLDPLLIKRVRIAQDGSRALSLNMDLQNVLVSGVSKGVVKEIKADLKAWRFYGKIFLPKLNFDSDYKVKGNVLAIQLNSHGKAKFLSENLLLTLQIDVKVRHDGDLTFLEVQNTKVNIKDIGNFHMQVDNLFNGQKALEEATNALFNENWRDLYESLSPAIEQTISTVFDDRLKRILHYVPASYFIADLPKA